MTEPETFGPKWHRQAFDDGWEGARQGGSLVEGAETLAKQFPGGYWSALVFGHMLYRAMIASQRKHANRAPAMPAPTRLRLSRKAGSQLPPNAVNVARPSPWGNPFVVGRDGTAAECVSLYENLMGGYVCLTGKATVEDQMTARKHVLANVWTLRGRPLACWCMLNAPCHADVLMRAAAGLKAP